MAFDWEDFFTDIPEFIDDEFPVPPERWTRVHIQDVSPKYTPRELGKALFNLHKADRVTAPQSFLDYVESLSPQPQGQVAVPSLSVEAQPSPPMTQAKPKQDDAPINSKRKISYLKFIYGLLKAKNLPTELNPLAKRDTTASEIGKVLESRGVSLDTVTIKGILKELEEKRNIILSS